MREFQNLLVTGGAGFIGSAFIRWLFRSSDWRGTVINFDALTYAGNLQNLPDVELWGSRYQFLHGDIRDTEQVCEHCRRHGIDAIVNFAAESHVDRSILGPKAFVETNIVGVFSLLEVARALSIHFHQVSTDEVFGSLGGSGKFSESTAYDPRSPYSASKAAADHLVRAYSHTYGLSTTLSNCSNNYGPYHFPEKLIPLMILNCFEGKPLPVYGDGRNIRDWLFVDDHAEAVWTILTHGRAGESYNVGGGCEMENLALLHQLIEIVARVKGADIAVLHELITFVKDRPGHDRRYAIDFTKIHRELGWQPRHTLASGLEQTVRWYSEHADWVRSVRSGEYHQWISTNYDARHEIDPHHGIAQ